MFFFEIVLTVSVQTSGSTIFENLSTLAIELMSLNDKLIWNLTANSSGRPESFNKKNIVSDLRAGDCLKNASQIGEMKCLG